MAKLGINTGIVPNDGLGDSLLVGAIKINSNFNEIYTNFGNGTNLTSIGGTWVSTSVGIHTLKNVGIGTTNPTSKLTVFGDVNITGIVTTSSLRGYSSLFGTESSTITILNVIVVSKTTNHRYFGTGSALGYHIDGIESPFLTLLPGKIYRFTQDNASNNTHQLLFYYQADRTTQYTTNVTTSGTAGSAGAYTEIVVTDTTPIVLHYQCINHGYMGNAAQFNSNVIDTPYQITARNGISVIGIVTATTFIGSLTGTATTAIGAQGLIGTPNLNVGIVTATSFFGNGSALTGIVGSGSGIIIKDDGTTVGTAGTIDFGANLSVIFASGIATITATSISGSSQFVSTAAGIHTLSNVGIGTTNPTSKLTVSGDGRFTGVVTATTFIGSLIGTATTAIGAQGLVGTPNLTVGVITATSINVGIVTATSFFGDGSTLTGVIGSGSGIIIKDDGTTVGTAGTIDFGANLSVIFASGIATITASGSSVSSQFVTTSIGIHTLSNVGIGTTNPINKLQIERFGIKTGFGTFTASSGITTDIDTFTISSTDFETSEYTLHFIFENKIQVQKVLIMQNGTTAYSQEYAIMFEPNQIVSIGATISSGICKLQVTPETGINGITTYRFFRETLL